jgi:hypothetical protein
MMSISDEVNGILIKHHTDWSGDARILWSTGVLPGVDMIGCWCSGHDLIAGRFLPTRAGESTPPVNVLTRAVALAVETYLRDKAMSAVEKLFIDRGKVT